MVLLPRSQRDELARTYSTMSADELIGSSKALLFDLDGTLVDTLPVIFDAYSIALRELGVPALHWDDFLTRLAENTTALKSLTALWVANFSPGTQTMLSAT